MSSERVEARIPIVELSGEKLKEGSDSWNSACQEIREALEKYGCFELIYNKFSIENHNSILDAMDQLFSLPDEINTKNLDPKTYSPKSSNSPKKFYIENATNKEVWQNLTNLLLPHGNQYICETVHTYANLVAEMEKLLVNMLIDSYKIDKEYRESHIKSTTYFMALNKYERKNKEDNNLNLRGHRDSTFFSILHQNHVKGLELRIKNGEEARWSFYEPSSHSSFIVFAGDVCMGWSNDRIKSRFHRVVMEGEEVRYMVGVFSYMKGFIKAPKELVDEEHPLKYKPFENQPYIESIVSRDDPNKYDMNNLELYCGI